MSGRKRLLALSLTVALLCTLGLYAYAWSITPRALSIGDIRSGDVGSLVRTQGHVRAITSLGSGGLRVELLDHSDFASISVYLSGKVCKSLSFLSEIVPGALLRVAGEVQEFNRAVEVAVSDPAMVELLERASGNRLDLGTLAINPLTFQGMNVAVRGEADGLLTLVDWTKASISSGQDSLWVDFSGGEKPSGRVDVFGRLLYNEGRGRFEVKVAAGEDAIRPHPWSTPPNYTAARLGSLLADPEVWEGRNVAVIDVAAVAGEVIGTSFSLSDDLDGERYTVSCVVFGWDWTRDPRGIVEGGIVEFLGTWDYYAAKAQWQVTSDGFTLRSLP